MLRGSSAEIQGKLTNKIAARCMGCSNLLKCSCKWSQCEKTGLYKRFDRLKFLKKPRTYTGSISRSPFNSS